MELVTDNASPTLPKVAATQRKSAWSEDEQAALAHSHAMLGNRWAAISKQMPGRSENDIKNFWHATLRSKGVRRSRFLFTYVCLVRDHCAEAATRRSALQQAREVCGGGGGGAGGRGAGQQQRPSNRTVGRTISFSGAVPQSPSSDGAAASGPSAAAAAAAVRRSISVSGAAAFAAAKSSYHAPAAAAATVTSPPLPLPQHASGTATPSAAYGAYGEPSPLSTTSQGNSPSGYQQQQLQQQLNHQHQQYQEQQLMPAHASWPMPRTDLSELRVLAVGAQGAMQTRWADNNPSANCHGGSSFASDGTTSVQHSEPYGSSLPYSADCLTRVSSVNLPQEQQQQQQQLAQQQQQKQQQSHVQGLPSPGAWPLAAAGGAFPDARALPRNAHSQPQPFVAGSERLLGGLAQGGGGDGGGVGCGAVYGSCPPQRTSDYGGSTSSGMGGGQLDGRPSYDGTANRSPCKRYVDMPIPQAIAAAAAAAGGGGGGDGSTVVRLPTRTLAAPMTRYDTTDLAATAGPVSASAGPDSSGGLLPPARPSAPLSMAPGVAPRPAAAAAAATHGGRGAAVTALGSPGSATAGGMPFDARSTRHHQQQRQQQQQQKQVSAFGEELMFAGCGQATPSQLQQHMQQQQRQYTTGDGYYQHHNQQQQQHQQQQQQDGDGAVSCHMVSPFSASSPLSEGGFGAGRATASGVVHVQQAYDQQQHLQHHHHQQQSHMTRQLSAPVGCGVGVRLDWRPLVGGPQSGGGGGGPHAAERLQRLLQQQRNWPVTDAATTMGLDTELLHELQLGPVQQQQQQVPLMRQAWAGQGPGL